jgi:hypothetical protein
MKRHTLKKLVLAVVFTLAFTFGIGVVGEQFGLPVTQTAHACSSANGGGC